MSIGYKCDNCLECFAGTSAYRSDNGRIDICPNCMRAISALNKIDPFAFKPDKNKEDIE